MKAELLEGIKTIRYIYFAAVNVFKKTFPMVKVESFPVKQAVKW